MTEIKFLKPISIVPRFDTSIYRLMTPRVNERVLFETAKRFNLKGTLRNGILTKDIDELTYTEGQFVINICRKSGALRYYDSGRWQIDDGVANVTIPDNEAVNIAKKFITQTKLVPYSECNLFKVTRLYVGTLERKTKKANERIIDIGIIFQRVIGKVPVEGPGGKVVVYIDHKGEVTGCDRIWREIELVQTKISSSQLQTSKYANDNLVKYWHKTGGKRIDVNEPKFGYFELGWGESQKYLQPAYVFPLTHFSSDERVVMKNFHVVPAAKKPAARLMPTVKLKIEQPVRKK